MTFGPFGVNLLLDAGEWKTVFFLESGFPNSTQKTQTEDITPLFSFALEP